MFSNFINVYFYVTMAMVILFAIKRDYFSLAFTSALLLLLIYTLGGWSQAPKIFAGTNEKTLRILSLNIDMDSNDYEAVSELIKKHSPDIVVLLELNKTWYSELTVLQQLYKHHTTLLRDDYFGVGLFSKHEFRETTFDYLAGINIPSVNSLINIDNQSLRLRGLHLDWPMTESTAKNRNRQLRILSKKLSSDNTPSLAVGDFNLTPWSFYYKAFVANKNIRPCSSGFSLKGTWPGFSKYLGIPIDHCFANSGLSVRSLSIGDPVNSDHLPIIIDIIL